MPGPSLSNSTKLVERRAARTSALVVVLGMALLGCDAGDERPLTLAERLAGSWELVRVMDGGASVTEAFRQTVGTLRLDLQSVGCCAQSATYRVTVMRPGGEVIETVNPYSPNEPGRFIAFNFLDVAARIDCGFELRRGDALILTVLRQQEDLIHWGVDYPFDRGAVFELHRR